MATTAERLGIVETKVANLDDKISDIQGDIKSNHEDLKTELKTMYDASCSQHSELAGKIKELEGFKMKWSYMIAGGVAVAGIMLGHLDKIEKFLK